MTGIITVPFHIGDFLSGTLHMDTLEKGAYIMLLLSHYQAGEIGIPEDDKKLSRIAGLSLKTWMRIKPTMQEKFYSVNGYWVNSKCVDVLRKVSQLSSSQRAKALKKHNRGGATAEPRQCQPKPKPKPLVLSKDNTPPISPKGGFEVWWIKYPHKIGKADAKKKFEAALKKADIETLMLGVQNYIETKPPDRPWCNPATWLHQERWLDQPENITTKGNQNGQLTHAQRKQAALDSIPDEETPDEYAEISGIPELRYIPDIR